MADQIVYKNIIGLSNEQIRKAVIEAIQPPALPTEKEARAFAKASVSPQPYTNEEGQLDIQPNKQFDQHNLTEQLETLPEVQIDLVENLLARLTGAKYCA